MNICRGERLLLILYAEYSKNYQRMAKWLLKNQLSFQVRRINRHHPMTKSEILELLRMTDNGFDDLLSKRSKEYKNLKEKIKKYSMNQMLELLVEYPGLMRYPILTDGKKILVGFNEHSIRVFIPHLRRKEQIKKYIQNG